MHKQSAATCKCCHCDEQIVPTWRNLVSRRIVMVQWIVMDRCSEDKGGMMISDGTMDRWTDEQRCLGG